MNMKSYYLLFLKGLFIEQKEFTLFTRIQVFFNFIYKTQKLKRIANRYAENAVPCNLY